MPASAVAAMPIRMALPTRRAIRMAITSRPTAARMTCGSENRPKATKVAGWATMILALRKPMKAMNRPMPAAVPYFRQSGMPFTIISRTLVRVSKKEEHAGDEDHAQRRLPGHAAPDDDRVGEVGIQRHAGRQRDGIVGPQSHDQRGERGGNARGEQNSFHGHAGFGKDARVDDHHIGHGRERGQARQQFAADRGVVFLEVKDALEQTRFLLDEDGPL